MRLSFVGRAPLLLERAAVVCPKLASFEQAYEAARTSSRVRLVMAFFSSEVAWS
jgi:hypothetical protein